MMLIHDDIFSWEGFGGALRLGSGKCRLRIYDLRKGESDSLTYLKPFLIVVSDVADSKMSVRSCAGHVATRATQAFGIDPHRMIFIEYYPSETYGERNQHLIPEHYELVEFSWHQDKALHPRWRPLKAPLLDVIQKLMQQ
ncbi:MAG: hypothetical protein AB1427_07555 [Thermodesulfobacteriota bacterium]